MKCFFYCFQYLNFEGLLDNIKFVIIGCTQRNRSHSREVIGKECKQTSLLGMCTLCRNYFGYNNAGIIEQI